MSIEESTTNYTPEELQNILDLVRAVKKIRQDLREEGIPIDEYEEILKDEDFLIE
jgi:hypothetical protein